MDVGYHVWNGMAVPEDRASVPPRSEERGIPEAFL